MIVVAGTGRLKVYTRMLAVVRAPTTRSLMNCLTLNQDRHRELVRSFGFSEALEIVHQAERWYQGAAFVDHSTGPALTILASVGSRSR